MITISVVSHGHGEMLKSLLGRLLEFAEVSKVVVTHNIPDAFTSITNNRVLHIHNPIPKGFGANHNKAFSYCTTENFCVLNPDIEFTQNPFPHLTSVMKSFPAEIAAPLVIAPNGEVEDSARHFPTLGTLILKFLGVSDGRHIISQDTSPFEPDWVAGMFLLFRSCTYVQLDGFDECFFLYYEDVDICRRAHKLDKKIVYCPEVSVVHHAQRASRHNFRHMRWHLASMLRYLGKSV